MNYKCLDNILSMALIAIKCELHILFLRPTSHNKKNKYFIFKIFVLETLFNEFDVNQRLISVSVWSYVQDYSL